MSNNQPSSPSTPSPLPRPTTQMIIGCFIIPIIVVILLLAFVFNIVSKASKQLTVPDNTVLLVRTSPTETAPLLARFGEGEKINIIGRSQDWQWLAVQLWDERQGWALRPLDIWIWRIEAPIVVSMPTVSPSVVVSPIAQEMVAFPAITFPMGSAYNVEGSIKNDEIPVHVVKLSAFEIDRTEVTIGQYWACVIDGACIAPTNTTVQSNTYYLNDPLYDNHPIVNIPWLQASHYCAWQGKRLPTEAEWEMAASWDINNQAKRIWPWGNNATQNKSNVDSYSIKKAAVVGSFPADRSPSGVLDMAGNVSEWVFDWYKVDYYSVADETDPIGPTHRRGEGSGRVVRGGSFNSNLNQARTTNRGHQAETYGYPNIGFRCAKDS